MVVRDKLINDSGSFVSHLILSNFIVRQTIGIISVKHLLNFPKTFHYFFEYVDN